MSEGCSGSCGGCSKKGSCSIEKLVANKNSNIKNVIGVVSGKGGVGKSLTTVALAAAFNKQGFKVGILDGDITGPSIPTMLGLDIGIVNDGEFMLPSVSHSGIKAISINLMLESEDTPVIWRGSMLANVFKMFWTDVAWGEIDYLFVDMPPGTGDIPLTAYQSLPLDGVVIVTSPQDLVSIIVKKAYNMAITMNIPVLGIIENMSYIDCSDCGSRIYPFGKGKAEAIAEALNIPLLAKNPINPTIAKACDQGVIEDLCLTQYQDVVEKIILNINK